MFRRYKSGGDEPGTKDEIVIKVDPIVPKSAPARSGKSAPPSKSAASKSGKSAAVGTSTAASKSAKSAAPAKSATAGKSAAPAKSATAGKSAAPAKSAKSTGPSRPGKSVESAAPAKSGNSGRRRFAWRIGDLLTGGSDEDLERELELEDDQAVATKAAEEEKRRAQLEAELQRESEEFGLSASDPISLYGPNGEEVAALIESLADMDDDLAEEIADSYELTPEAERKVAQSVVRRRHRGGKLWMELETAEGAVADWFSALGLVEDEDIALYSIVADAATDAVDALVLVDELADTDYTTLYGPWSEVMDVEADDEEEDEAEDEADDEAQDEAEDEADDEAEDEDDAEEGEFGPNTALVTELLTKLGTLDTATTSELIDVWREQPKEELRVAHRELQTLADESDLWREQMRIAQEEVFAWMDRGATRFNKLRAAAGDWARTREIAGPAVADAVAALVMADVLEAEDAVCLYAPWAKVVGEPAMPVYEDEPEEPKKSAKPSGGAKASGGAKPSAKPKGGPKG